MDETSIKEKILELKNQIIFYEEELIKVCKHKKLHLLFDKSHSYNDYVFLCDTCGTTFVTEDPNFSYEENNK